MTSATAVWPIWHDFMKTDFLDAERRRMRLHLTLQGTLKGLESANIGLKEGRVLHLYGDDADAHGNRDDLVVDGLAHYDERLGHWVALVDWDAIKHVSDVAGQTDHWAAYVDWAAVHAAERDCSA